MGKKLVLALVLVLALALPADAAVIFSENFDASYWNGWKCTQALPDLGRPTMQAACDGGLVYNGILHYGGEVTSPGRGGTGNCFAHWRSNGSNTEYNGNFNEFFTPTEFANHYKAIYSRYYMRMDVGFETSGAGIKLNRFFIDDIPGTNLSSPKNAFMVNIGGFGTGVSNGQLVFGNASDAMYYSEKTVAGYGLNDGNWHCFEVYLKMNSATGVADGEFHCWIDGTEIKIGWWDGTHMNYGILAHDFLYPTNQYLTKGLDIGLGNTAGKWNFPTNRWYGIYFDDYVVSTTRIGCDTTRMLIDSSAPKAPIGLKIIQ